MKKIMKPLVMATFLILILCYHQAGATHWERVAGNGFGDPRNDYAWSMATFQGKLYVGTLNGLAGAEIWASSSGESWQRVYNDIPSISNLGVRYLYSDRDQVLYAGTYNGTGAQILKTIDGQKWTTVARGGLGNRLNTSIRCIVRFDEYLYAGTGSSFIPFYNQEHGGEPLSRRDRAISYGARLYRSKDGTDWEMVKVKPGFDSTKVFDPNTNTMVTNNLLIGELAVFNRQLYAFTWTKDATLQINTQAAQVMDDQAVQGVGDRKIFNGFTMGAASSPGAFEVWRSSDGVNWEKVVGQDDAYGNGLGFGLHNPDNLKNDVATSATVFKGHLYLGTEHDGYNASIWRTADGTKWEKIFDSFALGEIFNLYVWRLIPFMDKLYVGVLNVGPLEMPGADGAQIWVSDSGDRGSFSKISGHGFDGETFSAKDPSTGSIVTMYKNYGIRTFGILNDTLFAGTATVPSIPIPKPDQGLGYTILGGDIGCEVWKMVP